MIHLFTDFPQPEQENPQPEQEKEDDEKSLLSEGLSCKKPLRKPWERPFPTYSEGRVKVSREEGDE